ncbi:hypothetical protein X777_09291, partial [Ooceraea biroi]
TVRAWQKKSDGGVVPEPRGSVARKVIRKRTTSLLGSDRGAVKRIAMTIRACTRVIMQLAVVIVSASNLIADADVDVDHREEWVVRVQGGSQVASLLAAQSGYKHHGP